MPNFDFTIAKNKLDKIKDSNKNKIISKDIKGIIWIDIKGEYNVVIEQNNKSFRYSIHPSCYSCTGHNIIYKYGVPFNDIFVYIRNNNCYNQNLKQFLPFAPGCIVIGDLVKVSFNINPVFIIKECWRELNNRDSHDAIIFYKEHIDIINKNIKEREINE